MPAVKSEVVELIDDFLAGLALVELGVLDDGGVDLLESEAQRDFSEAVEEPAAKPQIFRVEVPGAAGGL